MFYTRNWHILCVKGSLFLRYYNLDAYFVSNFFGTFIRFVLAYRKFRHPKITLNVLLWVILYERHRCFRFLIFISEAFNFCLNCKLFPLIFFNIFSMDLRLELNMFNLTHFEGYSEFIVIKTHKSIQFIFYNKTNRNEIYKKVQLGPK